MIITETFLMCDKGCGSAHGVDNRERSGKQQRESAKENGWIFFKGKDYCPECAMKVAPKTKNI